MKYTVYRVKNKINGKIYIGCHKTTNLDDGYMGSGTILKRAFEKYGLENFEKTILEVFDNPEDMFEMEAILVNKDDPNSYNIKNGGYGGFDYLNDSGKNIDWLNDPERHAKHVEKGRKNGRISGLMHKKRLAEDPIYRKNITTKASESLKKFYANGGVTFKGRSHSKETKQKMSESRKGQLTGKRNGSFGTMWITNGSENKKIKKTDLIPNDWYKGRKL